MTREAIDLVASGVLDGYETADLFRRVRQDLSAAGIVWASPLGRHSLAVLFDGESAFRALGESVDADVKPTTSSRTRSRHAPPVELDDVLDHVEAFDYVPSESPTAGMMYP